MDSRRLFAKYRESKLASPIVSSPPLLDVELVERQRVGPDAAPVLRGLRLAPGPRNRTATQEGLVEVLEGREGLFLTARNQVGLTTLLAQTRRWVSRAASSLHQAGPPWSRAK